MRLTSTAQKPRKVVAQGVPLPAPVGGWDAISPLANMPVDRAYQLDNWIPRPGWIEPRKGFVVQCTGLGSASTPVQTLMSYNGFGTVKKLFAIAGATIWDVTTQGSPMSTGVTVTGGSRFQHQMFSNASGNQYLVAVNGSGAPTLYDGTSWSNAAITGSGFDPTKFITLASHKGRMWFVENNSTNAVYLDVVGGIQGSASVFPLGQLMTRGGYIQAVGTWTIDTRQTVDEYIAFITSRGQVIVYEGTDPSSADTWNLVGVYDIGPPIGRRCFLRLSGDLLIITLDGVVPMSQMLSTDRAAANRVSITSIIMNQMAQAAATYKNNFGWELIEYPKSTLAILNIPTQENVQQMQFVMNTITGAWTRFLGINANCWEVDSDDNIYFGGNDGTVYQWDVGMGDNGTDITCVVKTAYNSFGNAAQNKRYTALQSLITTTGSPIPSIGINVDFRDAAVLSQAQPVTSNIPLWNNVNWNQFLWPDLVSVTNDWITVDGIGHYVSIVTQIVTSANPNNLAQSVILQLNGWNITAERGAFI